LFLVTTLPLGDEPSRPPTLDARLKAEGPKALARAALAEGDATRGAAVFHRPELTCVKCHGAGDEKAPPLGPDLARSTRGKTSEYFVESILEPSKVIAKGYETVTVVTADGQAYTGLLGEDRKDALVLRDPTQDGKAITIPKDRIDQRQDASTSLMPEGLINTLSSRREFLDLVRYLVEIAEHGPDRARALRPAPVPLPDYENDLDHAGLIERLDADSFKRGEAIYARVCANCHGTKDRPGSLPNAPRFATATLKNGSGPFPMYQTITRGFGQMAPQSWMVPRQKYDVIHYIREAYFRKHNPSQYVGVDRAYLAALPKGKGFGPEPASIEPWAAMDYGRALSATIEVGDDGSNIAFKGLGVRLDSGPGGVARGRAWMLYDHDTMRMAAAWEGSGFIDWKSIHFNGEHQVHPRVVGRVVAALPNGPGWADPTTGSFDDPRTPDRDGRSHGPLPAKWLRFHGVDYERDRVILAYFVGDTFVCEMPGLETNARQGDAPVFTRTIRVEKSARDLWLNVAPAGIDAAVVVEDTDVRLAEKDGSLRLHVPASATPTSFRLLIAARGGLRGHNAEQVHPVVPFLQGGRDRWPEVVTTKVIPGNQEGAFAVDLLPLPDPNPWNALLRPTGLDFLPDGHSAAVCTWDGDVWTVEGLRDASGVLKWRRIASGLFQPLGLKVIDGAIYVTCRDQLARLRDPDKDGVFNFVEAFNSDHQVTEHFHEFAMGLQTDKDGNFYYAKAARHGIPAVVPQHGTLLRVSKDGSRTDILATGFRAPNGVCDNGDSTFFLTDQEGFWTPKNRINWVRPGRFYGNLWGYTSVTDPADAAMEPPVCWITNDFDRSPGEIVRVDGKGWGPLTGSLLNLSYGQGKIFIIPHERVGDRMQGAMCALPLPTFPTGVMRGRFHPADGALYACGMFAWAGNQTLPGGLYRIRPTGKPVFAPLEVHARKPGLSITFSDPIDPDSVRADHFEVRVWSLRRTENYGSPHVNEHALEIRSARLEGDGRTVVLDIPELKPTWCYSVVASLGGARGEPVERTLHGTIHDFP
jgi:putative heme-binding domain-containing protein